MSKGFFSFTTLLLMGMTVLLGFGASEVVRESQTDGCHNATIFVKDLSAHYVLMDLEADNITNKHLTIEEMSESMTLQTDSDIVYWRDDGKRITGLLNATELKNWLRCHKNV